MERRLAAILAADIVGYSALMAEDEAGTLEALRRLRREVFHPSVAGHHGKVVKSLGDGWLVEFGSAVDAVNCAVQVQIGLERDPRIRVRIGIHLGDITHEDEDVYGDSVNVAARLEAIAEPGALVISDAVYGSLDGTLTPSFNDGGEQELKNIPRPVRVWTRSPLRGADEGSGEHAQTAPSPREFKTLIAIDPISTSDRRDEVRELAAALTSDLSRYLGEGRWYRALISQRPVAGSYRLSARLRARANRIRLEASISALDGAEVWSDKIDGTLDDVFDWQDDTAMAVASAANGVIGDLEVQRLDCLDHTEMSAQDLVHRALFYRAATFVEVQQLQRLVRAAMAKDDDWAMPYLLAAHLQGDARMLGFADVLDTQPGELEEWMRRGEMLAHQSTDSQVLLAYLKYEFALDLDLDHFRAAMNSVLRHAPYHHMALLYCGTVYFWNGEAELAVDHLRKIKNVEGGVLPNALLAMSLVQLDRGDEALDYAKRAVELAPGGAFSLRSLAAALASLGRIDEAQAAVRKLLQAFPDASISALKSATHFADTPRTRRYFDALRLAGVPEGDG